MPISERALWFAGAVLAAVAAVALMAWLGGALYLAWAGLAPVHATPLTLAAS
ncbi:MAG: hypothetical protein FD124_3646, partial [Alphaproteobacteria bacterium]